MVPTKLRPMGLTQADFEYLESLTPPRCSYQDDHLNSDWKPARPEWHGTLAWAVAMLLIAFGSCGFYWTLYAIAWGRGAW